MSETPKDPASVAIPAEAATPAVDPGAGAKDALKNPAKEFGGPKGPEPTRYGDWEKNGRCIDF